MPYGNSQLSTFANIYLQVRRPGPECPLDLQQRQRVIPRIGQYSPADSGFVANSSDFILCSFQGWEFHHTALITGMLSMPIFPGLGYAGVSVHADASPLLSEFRVASTSFREFFSNCPNPPHYSWTQVIPLCREYRLPRGVNGGTRIKTLQLRTTCFGEICGKLLEEIGLADFRGIQSVV